MSRVHNPNFFKKLSTAGYCVLAVTVCGILLDKVTAKRQPPHAKTKNSNERVLLKVQGIPIIKCILPDIMESGSGIQGEEANDVDIDVFLRLITDEFSELPSSLIAQSCLRSVRVCESLKLSGLSKGGCADYGSMSIYIDISDTANRSTNILSTIRHELFHILDKEFYRAGASRTQWEDLNRKDFTYGGGPASMQNVPGSWLPDESVAGFVNKYSTCDAGEDRAEIFSFMRGYPRYLRRKNEIRRCLKNESPRYQANATQVMF